MTPDTTIDLGFDFYQGPEVPPPDPIDHTLDKETTKHRRIAWAELLTDQIRYHNAWAILIVKPNTDVVLYDIRSVYKATELGYTAHLLLAEEAPKTEGVER